MEDGYNNIRIEDLCNGSTPDSDSVCGGSNPSSSANNKSHPNGWLLLLAEDEIGVERAAPVRTLVQKVSGGHFLARGRIHEFSDTSGTDADESSFGL